MESSSFQSNQPYSLVNRINLNMDFEQLMFSQEYYPSQDYSMGRGSAHGSAPVNDDEEDDSSVEEVSPIKLKKPSRRAARAKKNDPKEPPKECTVKEEIALCQAWCDVSDNNIVGNNMKTKGFWDAIITYFENKTGSLRGYDSILSKWKNKVRRQDFTLEHCYNILKDHQDKAEEETQEVRPPGCDQSKAKKKSAASSHGKSSSFVDLVADKFLNIKKDKWNKGEEQKQSYIQLKNRELDIREAKCREAVELKREKIASQRRTLTLAEREKRDTDILFYNTEINSSFPAIQQQKLHEMKNEITERYNLDY
nr:hypothetical protein [Tanacetum cinerariifolium]